MRASALLFRGHSLQLVLTFSPVRHCLQGGAEAWPPFGSLLARSGIHSLLSSPGRLLIFGTRLLAIAFKNKSGTVIPAPNRCPFLCTVSAPGLASILVANCGCVPMKAFGRVLLPSGLTGLLGQFPFFFCFLFSLRTCKSFSSYFSRPVLEFLGK